MRRQPLRGDAAGKIAAQRIVVFARFVRHEAARVRRG